jgi:hypothetical protein
MDPRKRRKSDIGHDKRRAARIEGRIDGLLALAAALDGAHDATDARTAALCGLLMRLARVRERRGRCAGDARRIRHAVRRALSAA